MEYIITKEQCEKAHKSLVCSGCGKPIEAIETVDNANRPTFWAGCNSCGRFQYGVPIDVWLAVSWGNDKKKYLDNNQRLELNREYCDIFQEVMFAFKSLGLESK